MHGLTALLYRSLRSSIHPSPSSDLRDRLKPSFLRMAVVNLQLSRELAAILEACQAAGLDVLLLRGFAMAALYKDADELTARPMQDLDLLVRREQLSDIAQVLVSMGYQEIDRRPGFARTFSYTLEFVRASCGGLLLVEPHWTIAYPPFSDRIAMDLVWKRAVNRKVVGMETRLLSPEDLVLHLCVHLIHRRESAPFLWYYELDRLLRCEASSLQWPLICEMASQSGQGLLMAAILEQLTAWLDTPIRDEIVRDLSVPPRQSLSVSKSAWLERRLSGLLTGVSRVDGLESFALLFRLSGFASRLRYTFALLFPSATFMRLTYGLSGYRLTFCYFTRIVFLLREGFRGLVALARTGPRV